MLAIAWGPSCAPPVDREPEPRPEVVLHGVTLRAFQRDRLAAVGRAARLTYERGSSNADVAMGHLELPSRPRPGVPSKLGDLTIDAPRAEGNLASQRVEGSGGVTVRTGTGVVAKTERAAYDGPTQVASGEQRVEVQGPSYALEAHGFTLRSAEEDFEFGGPVRSGLGKATP